MYKRTISKFVENTDRRTNPTSHYCVAKMLYFANIPANVSLVKYIPLSQFWKNLKEIIIIINTGEIDQRSADQIA